MRTTNPRMDRAQLIAHLSLLGFWPVSHKDGSDMEIGRGITDGRRWLWLTGKQVPSTYCQVCEYLPVVGLQEVSWDRLGYYFLSDFVNWLRGHP